jgi:hypothetical protein
MSQDFVRLMGTELSAVYDFYLPEYYFRVSREEDEANAIGGGRANTSNSSNSSSGRGGRGNAGNAAIVVGGHGGAGGPSGRFFSRIDRIPWEDM